LAARRLADVERELIVAAMLQSSGNKTRAARLPGISVRTIRNKARRYEKIFRQQDVGLCI
jgi:DNA-binding protein Fis